MHNLQPDTPVRKLAVTVGITIMLCLLNACVSNPRSSLNATNERDVETVIHFRDYRSLLNYIGQRELVALGSIKRMDEDAILKLAMESNTTSYSFNGFPSLRVMEVHFLTGCCGDVSRSASGNGSFYLFVSESNDPAFSKGLRLVGITHGNSYSFDTINNLPRIMTSWHMSSTSAEVETNIWNGKYFQPQR